MHTVQTKCLSNLIPFLHVTLRKYQRYTLWEITAFDLSRFRNKKEDEPSKEYTIQVKYLCMQIMPYGQVLFVVVRFIYWLSEIKRSEKAQLQSIRKSDKDPRFEPAEGSWNCHFKLKIQFTLILCCWELFFQEIITPTDSESNSNNMVVFKHYSFI